MGQLLNQYIQRIQSSRTREKRSQTNSHLSSRRLRSAFWKVSEAHLSKRRDKIKWCALAVLPLSSRTASRATTHSGSFHLNTRPVIWSDSGLRASRRPGKVIFWKGSALRNGQCSTSKFQLTSTSFSTTSTTSSNWATWLKLFSRASHLCTRRS